MIFAGILRSGSVYLKYAWYVAKYGTVKKVNNILLNQFERKQRKSVVRSFPYHVTIDPGNFCNLRCPGCHTGVKHPEMIDPAFLKLDTFKTVFNELKPYALSVSLYNWGEPFLNKQLFDIIDHAESGRVGSTIHSNFNLFNEKIAENAVKSGLTHIYMSIDGATQETYEKYRVKGNISQVLENVKLMLDTRKRLKSKFPLITWKYLVFEHNRHEVEMARKMASDLGVDAFEVFNGSPHLCDIYAYADEYRNEPVMLKELKSPCLSLWSSIYVNSDGSVLPCSLSFRQSEVFGNLVNESLEAIWNNDKYQNSRLMFSGNNMNKSVPLPCAGCKYYLKNCGFVNSYIHHDSGFSN